MNTLLLKAKLGSELNRIPYSLIPIIGKAYRRYQKDISLFESLDTVEKQKWIFRRVHNIVEYAIHTIPFYRDFYNKNGFTLNQLKRYEDIDNIPIITKEDLMRVPLEYRSGKTKNAFIANTGGSTGTPLSFYKTRLHKIKEMSYYHSAWSRLCFSKLDIRLQFVGHSSLDKIRYDLTRNRLVANIYIPMETLVDELSRVTQSIPISFLQGYPSVLYEFASFLDNHSSAFSSSGLKGVIKGIFLNSEYPYPEYRDKIERVFGTKTIASYGHTEGCALAFDFGNQRYEIMQSYGFVESKQCGAENHIISTSYDNYASPFIRYDTGDVIDSIEEDKGLILSFKMTDGGRSGQFIYDKKGSRISLTGLIFGRHHKLFNYCTQVQIAQTTPGCAIVYYVADENNLEGKKPEELFDSNDIEMDFVFERINQPIRTKAGKVLLLVSPLDN